MSENDEALAAWAARQAAKAPEPTPARAARIADRLNGWGKGYENIAPEALERKVTSILRRCVTDENGCVVHDFSPVRRTPGRDYYSIQFHTADGGRRSVSIIRTVWTQQVGPLAPNQALRLLCGNDRCVNTGHYEVFISGQALGIPGAVKSA